MCEVYPKSKCRWEWSKGPGVAMVAVCSCVSGVDALSPATGGPEVIGRSRRMMTLPSRAHNSRSLFPALWPLRLIRVGTRRGEQSLLPPPPPPTTPTTHLCSLSSLSIIVLTARQHASVSFSSSAPLLALTAIRSHEKGVGFAGGLGMFFTQFDCQISRRNQVCRRRFR